MPNVPSKFALIPASISLIGFAAAAGFFYAYSSSVMIGLDAAPAKSAIESMQTINREVRNFSFALSFFGSPLYALLAAIVCLTFKQKVAALWFGTALVVFLVGTIGVTATRHLPLNEASALIDTQQSETALVKIWSDYSGPWTWWNTIRALAAMISTLLAGTAIYAIGRA